MTDHQPTIRTPMPIGPCVSLTPARDPEFVVLEWRYAEVVKREVLHRGDLLAALTAPKAAEITTPEELDALPSMSVVRDYQGDEWTRGHGGMWVTPETMPFPSAYVVRKWGPLTLVSRPDAPTPPLRPETDREALRDDVMEAIEGAIPDDLPGYRQRYTDKAVERVLAVLAARQPAPTVSAEQWVHMQEAMANALDEGDGIDADAADRALRNVLAVAGIEVRDV